MQPWLDFVPREEGGCRRCGKLFRDGDVHVWACRERTRRFDFNTPREAGSPGLIRYEAVSRAYPVCGACLRALERGGHMGQAASRRLLWLAAVLAAVCALGGLLVPRVAPSFVSAFYRDGSRTSIAQ